MSPPPAYRSLEEGGRANLRVFRPLLRFLRPHTRLLWGTVGALVAASVLELAVPYAVKLGVDHGIAKKNLHALLLWTCVFGGLALVSSVFEYLRVNLTMLLGQRVIYDVRNRLFRHIQLLPLRFFDKTPVGMLVTRVTSDVEALSEMFSSGVATVCNDILTLVLVVGLLFWVDAQLALVALASLPIVVAFSLWFGKRMRVAFREVRSRISRLNGFQQEAFTGLPITRLFRREALMEERFDRHNVAYRDANFGAIFNFALYGPIIETLSRGALAAILVLAARRLGARSLTWGDFFLFWMLIPRFFEPIRDLSDRFNILQAALAAGERIFGILGQEPEAPDAPDAIVPKRLKGDVEFKDVTFGYLEGQPVLRDLSFRARPGRTIALVGPTGAGKTSIISLLSRLWDVDEGSVLVDGIDVRRYARRPLRSRIAVVLQDVFLFAGSVEENIRMGNADLPFEKVKEACEAVHADTFIQKMPEGYKAEITERGGNLSVGEKQLLAFARALAADPDILVLDEATSSIDTETERLIQSALERLLEGRTAIVIAHRLSTIRRADRILVLHHGRLVEQGTHRQLLDRGGLYARLHALTYATGNGVSARG